MRSRSFDSSRRKFRSRAFSVDFRRRPLFEPFIVLCRFVFRSSDTELESVDSLPFTDCASSVAAATVVGCFFSCARRFLIMCRFACKLITQSNRTDKPVRDISHSLPAAIVARSRSRDPRAGVAPLPVARRRLCATSCPRASELTEAK